MRHAKAGGETGTNGEFYEGGKFLPSTERPKGKPQKRRPPGKQQCEPYKWQVPPEGTFSIFHAVVGTQAEYVDRWDVAKGIRPSPAGVAYFGGTWRGYGVADLCERYNRGERWVAEVDAVG